MTYSTADVEAFGNRLHINTLLSVIVNSLAIYLILNFSKPIMGVYKYYILSTVIFAFLMDFHMTFIFGLFPIFSKLSICAAGIAKFLGPFWGATFQFMIVHITLSFCGLSLFMGLIYQYITISKNDSFLRSPFIVVIFFLTGLLYPLPALILYISIYGTHMSIENVKYLQPDLYNLFLTATCTGNVFSIKSVTYYCICVVQIIFPFIVNFINVYKIYKKLQSIKHQLSFATMKMKQQFLYVLILQLFTPIIFIMIPTTFMFIMSIVKIGNGNYFRNRLHINTGLAIIFNSLAAYLIIRHSSSSMKCYKYYILSTVIFAFLMDFHLTFIFGMYPLFPRIITCPAGIVSNLGPFWGETVQYATIHFTLSFCGLSVFTSLLYQYLLIVKKNKFLQTRKGVTLVGICFIIYPLPAFILHLPNINYPLIQQHIKETEPELYPFFIEASCNGRLFTNLTIIYIFVGFLQNSAIYFIAVILGFKIYKQLNTVKHQMTNSTLKLTKQFFITLLIQMNIPFLFILIPIGFIVLVIVFKFENIDALNQVFIQILSLHSVANALTIMAIIKPYRQKLYQWCTKLFCIRKNPKITINVENTVSCNGDIRANRLRPLSPFFTDVSK